MRGTRGEAGERTEGERKRKEEKRTRTLLSCNIVQ